MNILETHKTKILVGLNLAVLALIAVLGLRVLLDDDSTNDSAAEPIAAATTTSVVDESDNAAPESTTTTVAVESTTSVDVPATEPDTTDQVDSDDGAEETSATTEPQPEPEAPAEPQPPTKVTVSAITLQRTSECADGDSFCTTIAPTVVVTYQPPESDRTTLDNGTANQISTELGVAVPVFDAVELPYVEGWILTVFVRDDWSGRGNTDNHSDSAVVNLKFPAAGGSPELIVNYRVDVQ